YSLTAAPDDVLLFSFVGYVQQEATVGSQNTINIQLSEDVQQLQEVVVVGYGTQEKRDATGAVESVKAEDFNQGVISSPEELIQGKSAGVQITQASGEPGGGVNIRIRGTSSVRGGNNPLFVVDGVPLAGNETQAGSVDIGRGTGSAKNPLNFLNPNDIASIDILKDASATAIYGARGANGVILITTKSGKGAAKKLEYGAQVSVSRPANTFNLLDRDEFIGALQQYDLDVATADLGFDTDWQDVIFRTAVSTKHDLSYSDSYGSGGYRVSLGYQNQNGIVENTGLERFTGRINWNQDLFNDRLALNVQATASRVNDEQAPIFNTTGFEGDLLGVTYSGNPTWSDDPTIQPSNTVATPSAYLRYFQDQTETDRQLINASAEYKITDDFSARVNGGIDLSAAERGSGFSKDLALGQGISGNGRGYYGERDTRNYLLEVLGTYKKTLDNNSSIDALIGYSYQEFNTKGSDVAGYGFGPADIDGMVNDLRDAAGILEQSADGYYQAYGFDSEDFFFVSPFDDIFRPASRPTVPVNSVAGNSFDFTDELQSFFGRVNYNAMDKYLFTATVRVDGSTKFGGDNKYGVFPSGSFAWRLSEEDFSPEFFNDLKLRVGYGITGNQEIPHNLYQSRVRYDGTSINEAGRIFVPGLNNVAFGNPDLGWEETRQANIGADFAFGTGRLSGSLDFYRKVTTDLLIKTNSAQPAPQPFVFENLDAEVVNKGIELILNYVVIDNTDFGLDIGANGSLNDNVVQNYDGAPLNTGQINGQGLTGAFAQRIADGQPLYAFFLREFTGLSSEGQSEYVVDAQQFLDKSPLPKYNVGFNLNARYKRFDMAAYMYGQFGHYIYNNTANAFFSIGSLGSGRNITREALDEAIASGESIANTPDASTRYLEKGDFLRMQNLNFGYNAPLGDGSFIQNLRVFVSGQNLFVITDYSGLDPEINTDKNLDDIPSAGIDYTAYPRARTYTMGINATF
ncbi:MAG: SusC/RagA family TonB-linked outer membrane protein, partial [Cyclobacteriaceae bacterium]